MLKKIAVILAALLILVGGFAFYAHQEVERYITQPIQIEEAQLVTVEPGTHFNRLLAQLEANKWIESTPFNRLVSRLHPELVNIKVGTFKIESGVDLRGLLLTILEGKEHQFAITFIEGSRFSEWMDIFEQSDELEYTLKDVPEADIAKRLGIKSEKLEGLFLAETYHFTKGTTDFDILKRAHSKLNQVIGAEWEKRQKDLPLKSAYEALILASIIEKETALDSERERVSSVFVNRLNRGMRLQTDPTVIYGMGDSYDGNIRKKDLRTPTPYNTYTINGLPPTPIAMAGPASIKAALNPETSRYLYFVASGKGGHVFSKSLTEHNRAVRAYLKQLRSQK